MLRTCRLSLADAAFQHAPGRCNERTLKRTSISPEPETRNGLSLARNDAFATIARSTLLTCLFASTPKNFPNPFDPGLIRSVPVSKPAQGEINALDPLSGLHLCRSRDFRRSPLPSRSFEPSGSKRSTGSITRSSPYGTSDCLSLPAAFSFEHASDQCSEPVSFRLATSSRKPWN